MLGSEPAQFNGWRFRFKVFPEEPPDPFQLSLTEGSALLLREAGRNIQNA
jgi:hypothetical protein